MLVQIPLVDMIVERYGSRMRSKVGEVDVDYIQHRVI